MEVETLLALHMPAEAFTLKNARGSHRSSKLILFANQVIGEEGEVPYRYVSQFYVIWSEKLAKTKPYGEVVMVMNPGKTSTVQRSY